MFRGAEACSQEQFCGGTSFLLQQTAGNYLRWDTRTGSTSSLGGGITGGIALGVAFFLMQVPETRDLGEAVGFGAAVLFAAIFAIRLASTGKPVPSGPLLGLSAATSVIFALSYLETRVPLS